MHMTDNCFYTFFMISMVFLQEVCSDMRALLAFWNEIGLLE